MPRRKLRSQGEVVERSRALGAELRAALAKLPDDDPAVVDAIWRGEALGTLLWALQLLELPAYDQPFDAEEVASVQLDEADLRAQLETNFFGAIWVTQAALPIMRRQGSGHILQVTSEGGVTAFPGIGAYHASKWALEGLSQSLAQEVDGFGIHVTMVEPGPYATDWLGVGAIQSPEHPAYDGFRATIAREWGPDDLGKPAATRAAILEVVDAENPPLRVFFGKNVLAGVSR